MAVRNDSSRRAHRGGLRLRPAFRSLTRRSPLWENIPSCKWDHKALARLWLFAEASGLPRRFSFAAECPRSAPLNRRLTERLRQRYKRCTRLDRRSSERVDAFRCEPFQFAVPLTPSGEMAAPDLCHARPEATPCFYLRSRPRAVGQHRRIRCPGVAPSQLRGSGSPIPVRARPRCGTLPARPVLASPIMPACDASRWGLDRNRPIRDAAAHFPSSRPRALSRSLLILPKHLLTPRKHHAMV
jgi:hypothetical protein